jgi:hypothetical protein
VAPEEVKAEWTDKHDPFDFWRTYSLVADGWCEKFWLEFHGREDSDPWSLLPAWA